MLTKRLHRQFPNGIPNCTCSPSPRDLFMVTFAFIACLIACGCFGSSPSVPKSDEDAIKKAVIEEYGNRDKAIKVVKVKIKKFDVKSAEVTATLTWPEFHSVGQKRNVKLKKENGKWVVLSVEER